MVPKVDPVAPWAEKSGAEKWEGEEEMRRPGGVSASKAMTPHVVRDDRY
jgi:hypothetical protein